MGFIKGFIFGVVVTTAIGSVMSEQQRRNAAERIATTRERWRATATSEHGQADPATEVAADEPVVSSPTP